MANKENEKRFVLPLILACAGAIVLLHVLFWTEFTTLTHDTFFIALDILGIAGFAIASLLAWKHREDSKENTTRWIALLIAVFVCIWVGTWCSQYRADKSDHIEYKYGK